jgi:hypothetical protein
MLRGTFFQFFAFALFIFSDPTLPVPGYKWFPIVGSIVPLLWSGYIVLVAKRYELQVLEECFEKAGEIERLNAILGRASN